MVFKKTEAEKLYAYATKDGDILIETITDMERQIYGANSIDAFPCPMEK